MPLVQQVFHNLLVGDEPMGHRAHGTGHELGAQTDAQNGSSLAVLKKVGPTPGYDQSLRVAERMPKTRYPKASRKLPKPHTGR